MWEYLVKRHFLEQLRCQDIDRPRLRKSESNPPVIVVRGGAGAGKTVAAAQIAAALNDSEVVWCRVAPVVESNDDFWEQVLTAVGTISRFGSIAEQTVRGGGSTITDELIFAAFSEIGRPLTLVLDDLHHARSLSALQVLHSAVANTPYLRVILTTRVMLSAFESLDARMSTPVRVIDEDELAFTPSETAELVSRRAPLLTKDQIEHTVSTVQSESAGWPIAVHAGVIQRTESRHGSTHLWRNSFAKSYVGNLVKKLAAEEVQVLYVVAMFDEINVDVLSVVLEKSNEYVQGVLNTAAEASLRFWEDENRVRWYRHHDAIKDELSKRMVRDVPAEVRKQAYSRAAAALMDVRPRTAVSAAIQGEDWGLLAQILFEKLLPIHYIDGPSYRFSQFPSRVREEYPLLAAFALLSEYANPKGRVKMVIAGFKALAGRKLIEQTKLPGVDGLVAQTVRMGVARLIGNERLALEMAEKALETFEGLPDNQLCGGQGLFSLTRTQIPVTLIYAGRWNEAEAVLERFVENSHGYDSGSVGHAKALLALSTAWRGEDPSKWVEQCKRWELPVGWQSSYTGAGYRIAYALTLLKQRDYEGAQKQLDAMEPHESTIEHWPYLTLTRTWIVEATYGAAPALTFLEQKMKERLGRFGTVKSLLQQLQEEQARLRWHLGHKAKLRQSTGTIFDAYEAMQAGNPLIAMSVVSKFLADGRGSTRQVAEATVFLAYLFELGGDGKRAESTMRSAARMMTPKRLRLPLRVIPASQRRNLLRYVPELETDDEPDDTPKIYSLSQSEMRTLRAIAVHGTNVLAAQALFLSVNTVKSQLRSVYQKLEVSTREEALTLAAMHGLLTEDQAP